jgi:lysophospholipase L1-like esterase
VSRIKQTDQSLQPLQHLISQYAGKLWIPGSIILLIVFLFWPKSNESASHVDNHAVKILALGDSITQGGNGHPSYRRSLWFLLKEAGYRVDFVGSETAFNGAVPKKLRDFDQDHEGHWGWEAGEIDAYLATWLQDYDADIALIHAGTNDVDRGQSVESTLAELLSIVTKLRADNPEIVLLLAKIIPLRGVDATVFNNALESWTIEHHSEQSPLVVVDQFSGYDAQTDNYDKWHPNSFGEEKMAMRWFTALKPYLH